MSVDLGSPIYLYYCASTCLTCSVNNLEKASIDTHRTCYKCRIVSAECSCYSRHGGQSRAALL